MLPGVDLQDFLQIYNGVYKSKKLINIRGCNGSGKSTIPLKMLETDPDSYELLWNIDGKTKPMATVFPAYNTVAIGHYRSKCGGMDSVKDTDTVKESVRILWNIDMDILMEGVLASTVRQTYIDLFTQMNETQEFEREIIIYNILPPIQVCLDRIQLRNGGKPIKEELVLGKWNTVKNNIKHFEEAGFTCLEVSNEGISREETLDWYYQNIKQKYTQPRKLPIKEENQQPQPAGQSKQVEKEGKKEEEKKKSKDQKIKELVQNTGEPEELYLPTSNDLSGYEWAQYYKEPDDSVVINWNNMRLYWYWMAERMNIWYKRIILREPQPWTKDKIFQEYKFTNVVRDIDKGTIYYINNILSKMDEPCDDLVKRTKEVMLNTMIYRLFIKRDTVEAIGFLYLDTWKEQWEKAKKNLRAIKKSGTAVFHNAYYINDLKSANPDPVSSHDKTENAICLCEKFHENIDDIYNYVITHDMKDCLEYLTFLPAIGHFTIYEWMCDWGMSYKHVNNPVVTWTDDSYVNIGPGNKRGLDYIFVNRGNLDYYECNFYLRASWKHYMKRYGYYDRFVKQLPEFMGKDLNMRVIEHDLCELQKYLNAYYEIGRPKAKFNNESKDNLDSLTL